MSALQNLVAFGDRVPRTRKSVLLAQPTRTRFAGVCLLHTSVVLWLLPRDRFSQATVLKSHAAHAVVDILQGGHPWPIADVLALHPVDALHFHPLVLVGLYIKKLPKRQIDSTICMFADDLVLLCLRSLTVGLPFGSLMGFLEHSSRHYSAVSCFFMLKLGAQIIGFCYPALLDVWRTPWWTDLGHTISSA